jgi:hypothetical protein
MGDAAPPDPREKVGLAELEAGARRLAQQLNGQMPPGVGFMLFLFEFGAGGNLTYIGNGDRKDTILAMLEWLDLQLRDALPVSLLDYVHQHMRPPHGDPE